MTVHHQHYEIAAQNLIERIGKKIIIGVPIGLGKPVGLLNALYLLASKDQSIQLTIVTGLTFSRPIYKNKLEKAFVAPIIERLIKDYEDPLYEEPRVKQKLPKNINVIEFFLSPGKYLHNPSVQQNYISSDYSDVVRDGLNLNVNVWAQQVTISSKENKQYSLSCNADVFHAVKMNFACKNKPNAIVAEINQNLPVMYGDAIIDENIFTDIIDVGKYHTLFAIPYEEISPQDHMIGLYTSSLIKDDSCLQIGIGKLGNALASALIMRHQSNHLYFELLNKMMVQEKFGSVVSTFGETGIFNKGLCASTEMFSDEYMQLYKKDILKKSVYDHVGLQKLLNEGKITEHVTPRMIDMLLDQQIIHEKLTSADIQFLKRFGIFKPEIQYQNDEIILPSGIKASSDLSLIENKKLILSTCLGDKLISGKIIHAGFFFGSSYLYQYLLKLSYENLQQINMTGIERTNLLSWHPELLKLQRTNARFLNTALMVTLAGAVVSDGLNNLQEISGIGGQFDFVYMASQLNDARSIIGCRSTRETKNGVMSNIVWEYPNNTIPRYLRDIVVTEYGIADCRSKTDAEVIKTILNVTDSRFQAQLLKVAKQTGKLPYEYEIPVAFKQNYPEKIIPLVRRMQSIGYCQPYPFGSDLSTDEQVLALILSDLKNTSRLKLIFIIMKSLLIFTSKKKYISYLQRMNLDQPRTLNDFIYQKIFIYQIRKNLSHPT